MSDYKPADTRYDNTDGWFRRCGRSGLKLPAISLGCWHNFGGPGTDAAKHDDEASMHESAQQMLFAARAAGIVPLGFIGSIAEYQDQDKFRRTIRQARRLGFFGAACIHPTQVTICNEEFAPGDDEIATARAMIDAYDDAIAAGRGSVEFQGQMIDEPVVDRARRTLALAQRINARQNAAAPAS